MKATIERLVLGILLLIPTLAAWVFAVYLLLQGAPFAAWALILALLVSDFCRARMVYLRDKQAAHLKAMAKVIKEELAK